MNKKYHYDKKSDSLFICLKEGEEEQMAEKLSLFRYGNGCWNELKEVNHYE